MSVSCINSIYPPFKITATLLSGHRDMEYIRALVPVVQVTTKLSDA